MIKILGVNIKMAEIIEVPLDQPEPEPEPAPASEEVPEPTPEPEPAPKAKPKAKPKGRPKGSLNRPKPAPKAAPPPADIEEMPSYVQAHLPPPRDPMATLLDALVQSERARRDERSARFASWVSRF